jgi:hypothetical protein
MMFGELILAIGVCLIGAGMITGMTQILQDMAVVTTRDRLLHLLAAGWLVLFAVFLSSLLASALEAVSE